jgi:hypothetical protein
MNRNDPWDVLCAGIDQKMATGHYAGRYEAMLAVQRERPELLGVVPPGMRGEQISAPRTANARG